MKIFFFIMDNYSNRSLGKINKNEKFKKLLIFEDSFNVNPLNYKYSNHILDISRSKSLINIKHHNLKKSNLKSQKNIEKSIPKKISNVFSEDEEKINNFSKKSKKNYEILNKIHKNLLLKLKNYEICSEVLKKTNEPQINLKIIEDLLKMKLSQKTIMGNLRKFDKIYIDIEKDFKDKVTKEMLKKIEIHKSQLLYLYKNLEGGVNEEINRTLEFMPNVLERLENENKLAKIKMKKNKDKEDIEKLKLLKEKDSQKIVLLSDILKEQHTLYL